MQEMPYLAYWIKRHYQQKIKELSHLSVKRSRTVNKHRSSPPGCWMIRTVRKERNKPSAMLNDKLCRKIYELSLLAVKLYCMHCQQIYELPHLTYYALSKNTWALCWTFVHVLNKKIREMAYVKVELCALSSTIWVGSVCGPFVYYIISLTANIFVASCALSTKILRVPPMVSNKVLPHKLYWIMFTVKKSNVRFIMCTVKKCRTVPPGRWPMCTVNIYNIQYSIWIYVWPVLLCCAILYTVNQYTWISSGWLLRYSTCHSIQHRMCIFT